MSPMGPAGTKLLVITERFYPEEFIINDPCAEWVKLGFQVGVLTQAPSYPYGKVFEGYRNHLYKKYSWNGLTIHRFCTVPGYNHSLFLKLLNYANFVVLGSLLAAFLGRKYDQVFIYQTGPLTMALPAVIIRKLYRKKISIWTQDIWPDAVYAYGFKKTWLFGKFLNFLVRSVYSNCDKIFVSCEGFAQRIKQYVPTKSILHFPNWPLVDCRTTAQQTGKLPGKLNFTFAGNIGTLQNLENVIIGFALFAQQGGEAQLNLIGDGSNCKHLQELVEKKKILNVVFWGRKKPSETAGYLLASDVLIISLAGSPVLSLTVPSKFQTYLTAGKPIFCLMNGEVRSIVEKHNLGIYCPPESVDEIARGFQKFSLMGKSELKACGQRGLMLAQTEYSKNTIIREMTRQMGGRVP